MTDAIKGINAIIPAETLNDKVYQKIKNDIMSLVLEPGVAVSVQKLADAYGSSRTPVRESIVRLQQEGLVIIYPQARTCVSPISSTRISEECFIRRSLELTMVDDFIKRYDTLTADTLEKVTDIMRRMMRRQNIADYLATDSRFHRMMFEAAEQYLACDFIESSNTHYNRLRYLAIKHRGFDGEHLIEHTAIVEAARRRDCDSMKAVLTRHLREERFRMRELQESYPAYFA